MKSKKIKLISCREVAKHICENLDEKVNSRLCRDIKKHLQECTDCGRQLASLKKIISLYREIPPANISHSCHKQLVAKLSAIRHRDSATRF